MDKIYSRPRINLKVFQKNSTRDNKGNNNNKDDKNNFIKKYQKNKKAKILKIIMIITIAIITVNTILQAITPILDRQCEIIAKGLATKISNEQATVVMSNYKYEDIANIIKDTNGNITMISANVIKVNEIISDIAIKIQEELNKTQNSTFNIRLGSFTGSKLLSGRGPNVEVKISTVGTVETDLKSEFSSAGINQTIHRIYLEVKCNVIALTPFNNVERQIVNQVALIDAVIVGTTPQTYYNFTGIGTDTDTVTNVIN